MKLYKISKTTRGEGFLESDQTHIWYRLNLEDAELIESEDQMKKYNTHYAIVVNTEKMNVNLLLEALINMPVEEVKEVLDADPWVKAAFLQYIGNPWCVKAFKEKIKEIEDTTNKTSQNAGAAAALAGVGVVGSLF